MATDTLAPTGSALGDMQRAADAANPPGPPEPQEPPPADPPEPAPPEPPPEPSPPEPAPEPAPPEPAPPEPEGQPDLFDVVGDPNGSLRQRFHGDEAELLRSLSEAHRLVGKHSEELSEFRKLKEQLGAEGLAAVQAGKRPGEAAPAKPDGKPSPTWREYQLLQQQVVAARQAGQEVPPDILRQYNEVADAIGPAQFALAAQHPRILKVLEAFEAGQLGGVDPQVLDQRLAETERKRTVAEWAGRNRSKFYDESGKQTSLGDQVAAEAQDMCRVYREATGQEIKPHDASVALWEKALATVQSRQQPPKASPKPNQAAARKPAVAPPDKVPQTKQDWFKADKGDPKTAMFRFHKDGPGAHEGA